MTSIFLTLLLLLASLPAQAAVEPGTDQYLRETMQYTDANLTSPVPTEKRELFPVAQGATSVTDPVGDVLNRVGNTSPIGVPWMDLVSVSLKHNAKTASWDFTIVTAATIPTRVTEEKAEFFIMIDKDGDAANNKPVGFNGSMDTEYALQWDDMAGWYTDYRWYNQPVNFWAMDKETAAKFSLRKNTLVFSIPYTELPAESPFAWRVSAAVADGTDTAIDTAPGVGFPAPATAAPAPLEPVADGISLPKIPSYGYVILVVLALAVGAFIRLRRT